MYVRAGIHHAAKELGISVEYAASELIKMGFTIRLRRKFEKEKIIELYNKLQSSVKVARALNVSNTTGWKWVKKSGIKPVSCGGVIDLPNMEIKRAYKKGVHVKDLAELYNVSIGTIYNKLRESDCHIGGPIRPSYKKILATIKKHNGNRTKAAKELGLGRCNIYYYLRKGEQCTK